MSGPYDQQYYNYSNQYQSQSSYPSQGFSGAGPYQQPTQNQYPDTRSTYPDNSYGANNSYYNNTTPDAQGPDGDRGLLGAAAGGAAGAFGGHKVGHGILGALGGAIVGSLTEDYAKKGKKGKHGKRNKRNNASSSDQSSASGGLGSMASGFFNKK